MTTPDTTPKPCTNLPDGTTVFTIPPPAGSPDGTPPKRVAIKELLDGDEIRAAAFVVGKIGEMETFYRLQERKKVLSIVSLNGKPVDPDSKLDKLFPRRSEQQLFALAYAQMNPDLTEEAKKAFFAQKQEG